MKFHYGELVEYYLEGTATEELLSEILESVTGDASFRQELAEASRMRGLLVSMNQKGEDAVYRVVSRSIAEMEPESIVLCSSGNTYLKANRN